MTVAALTAELHPPLTAGQALLEADRCLGCGGVHAEAPCAAACPADVDVPGFITAIAAGDLTGRGSHDLRREPARRHLRTRLPRRGVCAKRACVLQHEGRAPIAIGALQRYATDAAFADGVRRLRERAPQRIGRSPLSAQGRPDWLAPASSRRSATRSPSTTSIDEVGGLVRYAIAPYREQCDPLPAEAAALEALGVEFRLGTPCARLEALEPKRTPSFSVSASAPTSSSVTPAMSSPACGTRSLSSRR